MLQRHPQFAIYFRSSSCFEHSGVQLNMSQSNLINNWTVKFVVSYCIVSKQVEVSTILILVESTGSWLHADTCSVFVRWVGLEIYCTISFELTYFTAHKSTSVLYGKKHYISITSQCKSTGQVPASSQEPVDSNDVNIVETSTCLETTQQKTTKFTVQLSIESDWSMFSCGPECSKQLPLRKYYANWGCLGALYRCWNLSKSSFREGTNNGVWK